MKNRMSETRHGRLERCIFCQRKERPCTAVDDGSAPLSHVFVCLSKAGRGARSLCAIISFQQSVLKCYHHPSSLFLPFFQMLKQNPLTELKCTRSSQKYRSADIMSASRVFILIFVFVPLQQLLVTSHKPSCLFISPSPSFSR